MYRGKFCKIILYTIWFYMNSSAVIIKMKLNTAVDTIVWEVLRYHIVK